ncbi:MAG: CaiB/BaiF CoA-transferase family protein [Pseudomonadota bacterium]
MGRGPLEGVRIVEFAGVGPCPMAAMVLADLGANIVRIDRPTPSGLGVARPDRFNLLNRNRRSMVIDLKNPEGVALALDLVAKADALLEGFRPRTMERIGLGPDVCLARNPRLVYGRMTGWGQTGPLAMTAAHDINYVALTGALAALGRKGEAPALPLNLLGDFAGGAMYLAVGVLSGILSARSSGAGQVVDAAIVDGVGSLMTLFHGSIACGVQNIERGTNITDGGAYFWDTYLCADGKYVTVAPIEAKFRLQLLELIGLDELVPSLDERPVSQAREIMRATFATRTRAEWCAILEGTDACFAPVLTMKEAPAHPHNAARNAFLEIDGIVQPAPAPRFDRTPTGIPTPPQAPGEGSRAALADWGWDKAAIDALCEAGVVTQKSN